MSDDKLQKIPTEWLDEHDDKTSGTGGCDLHGDSNFNARTSQEFEIIIGTLSKQSSLKQDSEIKEDSRVSTTRNKCGEKPGGADGNKYSLESCCRPLTLSYFDIGASRLIQKRTLLYVRVGSLAVLGIFAGIWLSKRESIRIQTLLRELFVWNHGLFLLVQPFMVAGSLMAIHFSPGDQVESYIPSCSWTIVAVSSHVVKTFSITEVLRMLTLHAAQSLQPSYGKLETKAIFSLGSVFAVQRYVLAAASLIEIVCSATPQHVVYILIVSLIAVFWEILVFVIRNPSRPLTERMILLCGGVGVVIVTSTVIVLLCGYLTAGQVVESAEHEGHAAPSSNKI